MEEPAKKNRFLFFADRSEAFSIRQRAVRTTLLHYLRHEAQLNLLLPGFSTQRRTRDSR